MATARRPARYLWGAALALALGTAAAVVLLTRPTPLQRPSLCFATVNSVGYALDLDQAANAATITAVAVHLGLPDHAVTVALAAALQESQLHNIPYGDRDSVGLFQQRPSQGWGTRTELLDPVYAATAFYRHLVKIQDWAALPVAEAAQLVQRSADPGAYADWEPQARASAEALSGEVPAAFGCYFTAPAGDPSPAAVTAAASTAFGFPAVGVSLSTKQGWTVASWLVAHASGYRITSVSYAGHTWTHGSERWSTGGTSRPVVTFQQFPRN